MPIILSKSKDAIKTKTIQVDGEPLEFSFCPAKITFNLDKDLREMQSDPEPEKALATLIAGVVKSWDLEDQPGEVVPLTEEALMNLPSHILLAVLQSVRTTSV